MATQRIKRIKRGDLVVAARGAPTVYWSVVKVRRDDAEIVRITGGRDHEVLVRRVERDGPELKRYYGSLED